MSLCDDCFKGVRHEGEPTGKIEQIGGVECYVATPEGNYSKDKVLLFLTDVFGIPLVNNKLLAGDFARNGIKVDALTSPTFDRVKWFSGHGVETWQIPADLEVSICRLVSLLVALTRQKKYRDTFKAPLLINSCEVDTQLPKESQVVADELLGSGKFAPGYERTYWDGCTHGFAVRGDMSNPKVKAGMDGAFKATVDFVKKYL
ncbi:uncharacterized protein LAESUDRAFT_734918 [Laetiporus sulphureus 93-53]|uniref:Dienelactone hydrolase domain-containing protein n=1 Tax=Laetiporus sulphureus 93-53 TaxID=1314785 RepID=A0A165G4P5_9APHY|nr:uncharacterized protein LAESUDRAFT_734918 [Laetiporus sulphureus 93-53]KZT09825.1 hypothetical protein LAESUDRAFT_734918 [Laetiporus sulphureus 93-53]